MLASTSSVESLDPSYDVVIAGARCAGAGTALLLARSGVKVLAIDRSTFGSDTLSTLALMRGGVLQLCRWNLLTAVRAANTPPVESTSFHYGDEIVDVSIKPRGGIDALYAPRRTLLDSLLARRAAAAGAVVMHGPRVIDLTRSQDGRVDGVIVEDRTGRTRRIRAGIVIGADGQRSTVARLTGAQAYQVGMHGAGIVYGLWRPCLRLNRFHWCYRPGVSVGVIPTNDDLVLVFVAVPAQRFANEIRHDLGAGYHRVLKETAPELARSIKSLMPASRFWAFPGQPGYFRQSWGPGWALVGDAGYFKDPITAHGITDALRDAELVARAVLAGSERALAEYQAVRDDLSRGVFAITDRIASFEWTLSELKDLHHALSREMQREVSSLHALDLPPVPVAIGAAHAGEGRPDRPSHGDVHGGARTCL